MNRLFVPTLALCAAVAAAAPADGRAQLADCGSGGTIALTLNKVGDRLTPNTQQAVLTAADCEADATIEVTLALSNADLDRLIYIYTGDGCEVAANRSGTGNNMTCTFVRTTDPIDNPMFDVELSAVSDLKCRETASRRTNIWFIPADSQTEDASNYVCRVFETDVSAPNAVTGVRGSSGEHVVPISWDAATGTNVTYHVVWQDAGGGDGGAGCSTANPFPVAGEGQGLVESDLTGFSGRTTSSTTSAEIKRTASGFAWAAVAAEDESGNIGALSSPVCVEFVDALSFSESFEAAGGSFDGGCAVAAGRQAGHTGGLLLLAALGLLVRRRRS